MHVNGVPLDGFKPDTFEYELYIPYSQKESPNIDATAGKGAQAQVFPAPNGLEATKIEVSDINNPEEGVIYSVRFIQLPDSAIVASDGTGEADNTVDKDLATRWKTNGAGFIQYELDDVREGGKIGIRWDKALTRRANFSIYVSGDGCGWRKAYEGQSSGRTGFTEKYPVSGGFRFVRIVLDGNNFSDENAILEVVI
jgi:hypothetical protein